MGFYVAHHGEECECEYCGYPLYVRDSVYEGEKEHNGGHAFCCKMCAEKYEKEQ
jgi:hypothetical protein